MIKLLGMKAVYIAFPQVKKNILPLHFQSLLPNYVSCKMCKIVEVPKLKTRLLWPALKIKELIFFYFLNYNNEFDSLILLLTLLRINELE